jgi:hypothetical protein
MPSGIIIASGSSKTTKEDLEKELLKHVDDPEDIIREEGETALAGKKEEEVHVLAEPKKEDFENEEDFKVAHEEWTVAQQKPELEESDEEDEEAQPKRKPSKFQKRIDKITGRLRSENDDLKKRLEALEKGGKKEEVKEENPRPKRTDFQDDDKYEDALLAWGIAKAETERTARQAEDSQKEQMSELVAEHKARTEAYAEEHPEFLEDVKNSKIELPAPIWNAVYIAICEEENGPEMLHYLSKHPLYIQKLSKLSPSSANREVGRLSDKLKAASGEPESSAGSGAPPKPKPKAPEPIRPVSTAASSSTRTVTDIVNSRQPGWYKEAKKAYGQGRFGQGR